MITLSSVNLLKNSKKFKVKQFIYSYFLVVFDKTIRRKTSFLYRTKKINLCHKVLKKDIDLLNSSLQKAIKENYDWPLHCRKSVFNLKIIYLCLSAIRSKVRLKRPFR